MQFYSAAETRVPGWTQAGTEELHGWDATAVTSLCTRAFGWIDTATTGRVGFTLVRDRDRRPDVDDVESKRSTGVGEDDRVAGRGKDERLNRKLPGLMVHGQLEPACAKRLRHEHMESPHAGWLHSLASFSK